MKINKFSLVLVVIAISSFTYFVDKLLVSKALPFNFAQTTNILYAFLIFLISFFAFAQRRKIVRFLPLNLYAILILWLFVIGFLFNSPIEVIPSLIRFTMYYLVAILTYIYLNKRGITAFNDKMRVFILVLFFIAIFFGFFEVFFLDIRFMNGAYRFSGSFLGHPLANSMFLVILIILWIEYFLVPKKNLFTFIGFLLLFYLFFNTHSRMPLAFLFLSFLAYYFFKEKRAFKFLKSLMMILLVFFGLYLLVAKTDVSPRLKKLVVSENAFKDPSSNTRFVIIENSVLEMTTFEKTIGIGLGGFNDFYFGISNKDGVAAHNNFLLFFAEGGIIGLFLFIVYQIVLFRTLFRFIRKPPIIDQKVNYQRMIFVSVFLLEICSFLLNNYYFFTSQTIVFILIGLLMYLEVYKIKPHNLKIANGSQA